MRDDWRTVEARRTHAIQSMYGYATTGTWEMAHGMYPAPYGEALASYVACAYCGSEKVGTGPGRCPGCGASDWVVRKMREPR